MTFDGGNRSVRSERIVFNALDVRTPWAQSITRGDERKHWMTLRTSLVGKKKGSVVRSLLALIVGVVAAAQVVSMPVAQAEDQEATLAGKPLNFGGLYVPSRQFISSGAALALERYYVDMGLFDDPYLSAAQGTNRGSQIANQQVPFRNPAPAFSRNLLITRNFGYAPYQTEPHLVVNPLDPDHLIMGTIDYNMGSTMSVYVSFDAGATWDGPRQILRFRDDIAGAGDPVLAFDKDGNAYICMISIGVREFVIGSIASEVAVLNMAVTKSTDGGLTWTDTILASEGEVTTVSNVDETGRERGTITMVDLDKPWMATGPHPDDPDRDVLYMSYTEFRSTYSIIYADELAFLSQPVLATTIKVVASEDGGASWSDPVSVSPTVLYGFNLNRPGATAQQQTGEAAFSSRVVQGSQVTVLPDGTLAVTWYDSTDDGANTGLATLGFATSTDAGATFSDVTTAGVVSEAPWRLRSATFRNGALPAMASGPDGEIYIVWAGRPPNDPRDDSDIYLFRSFNTGETWEEAVLINQDRSGKNQFFPQIAVSPNGVVHAMWGDQRDDPVGLRYHIYYSQSEDQGETWGFTLPDQDFTAPDTRVTDFASNPMKGFPGGRFIGDYMGIAATDDNVFLVWPDTRLGEYGGFNQQIGFARQSAIESPSLFLSPPSGSAGRVVDIQGFGFQPDSIIQLYVSGVITAQLRTDNQGQFQTSIYMPLTGEGPTEIRAFDETGNVATGSFYTEFGFDTLQESLESINAQLNEANGSNSDDSEEDEGTSAAATPAASGTPEGE
jgi:hypothetical protein